MAEGYGTDGHDGHDVTPSNRDIEWERWQQDRRRLMREQIENFLNTTIRSAYLCLERFKDKGIDFIWKRFHEKEDEGKVIFNKIEDLQSQLNDILLECQNRNSTVEEAEIIEMLLHQIAVEHSEYENTIPDIKTYMDKGDLMKVFNENLPFED